MSRRRHRILHVVTRLDLGGAQQNTLYCCEHHDRRRFEVGLVAGRGGWLDRDALGLGAGTTHLVPWLVHPISPVRDLVAVLRLARHLSAHRIDLVHTHSSKAGAVGRIAARLAGVPHVVHTVHGWSFNASQPRWQRRFYTGLERWLGALTDRWLVVSEWDRRAGLAHGIGRPERYRLLRSGISFEAFAPDATERARTRAALGYGPDDLVVGTLACLKPQKAPLDFVRAAAAASREDARLRFFIAGDGELRPAVEAQVEALGLGDVVRLLGWRQDAADLLRATDIFLLTSLFEGLPRSVLQAMAAGVPVVATAVNGTPEVVSDGATGLLVPSGDPASAARAVLRMARDEALRARCSAAARRRLGREFDIGWMVRELERIYLELLEPGGDPQGEGAPWTAGRPEAKFEAAAGCRPRGYDVEVTGGG